MSLGRVNSHIDIENCEFLFYHPDAGEHEYLESCRAANERLANDDYAFPDVFSEFNWYTSGTCCAGQWYFKEKGTHSPWTPMQYPDFVRLIEAGGMLEVPSSPPGSHPESTWQVAMHRWGMDYPGTNPNDPWQERLIAAIDALSQTVKQVKEG